ncbi:uncharacterized protein LOC117327245 [Pecten maximus]|uniref:uncharacterized protein LOC117327245 n=1 Tax=Pecten maximus TaxID=6579 RepID=UPI001458F323|nr:uncharacterized protein LOC117327245 [Pecten maximus]
MDSDEDDRIGFENQARMDPFDVIINDLIMELDADDLIFNEVVNLSKTPLGFSHDLKSGEEYFRLLGNNLGKEDMLDFLINVTDYQNWHCDFGTERVADRLKKYKDKLEKHKQQWRRKDIFDPNFVGRDKEINSIMEGVQNEHGTFTGVSIFGSGGIGKTSLGNEVCRRLWALSKNWQVIKIDLRGKYSMGDLMKDIILELQLKDDGTMSDADSDDLQNSLKDAMESRMQANILNHLGKITRRTIVMLDNVDDIIHKNEKGFIPFVKMLLNAIQTKCKVRVIITSRVSLQRDRFGGTLTELRDLLSEVEVRQLQVDDAKELIRKCTPKGLVSEEECYCLVKLTERNPLALRTICSILKNCCRQVKPAEVIRHLRSNEGKLSMVGMEKCLQESFDRLEDSMKNILIQLTLFKTSPFDINAASEVLRADNTPKPQILLTKMNLFHLKSRHLIEVQDTTIQTEGNLKQNIQPRPEELGNINRNVLYSLHPLVFEFLTKQKSQMSAVLMPAKIRFFEYMERIIGIIGKEQENYYYSTQLYLREYHVHIQSYFDITLELQGDIETRRVNMTTSNRILEIGRRVLNQDGQLRWLQWVTDRAERNGQVDQWVFYRGYMIQLLTEMDTISDIPSIMDVTERKLDMKLRRPDTGMKVALGNYHHKKAMYFKKIDNRQKVIENLEKARQYLEDEDIRPMTNMVMILANVYNDLGCSYYLHDSEKCRSYHEKAISKSLEEHPDVDMFKNNLAVCQLKDILDQTLEQSSRDENIEETLEHFSNVIAKGRRQGTDNTDSHTVALRNRSTLYLHLKRYEEAYSDAKKSLEVRKKILKDPHEDLTLSCSHVARILYNWGDQQIRSGNIGLGFPHLKEAIHFYDEALTKIKNGGLSIDHEEYAEIKKFHLKAVNRVDTKRKQHLEQEYQDLVYRRSSILFDREDSGHSSDGGSDEQGSSTDDLMSDIQTDSSQDEQIKTSRDEGTLKEMPVDTQKTLDDTMNFLSPMSKGKGRYEHQDSGYVMGGSTSSFRSSTSRRLSRQESFEVLDRPSMTSNTSGSSEDVFPPPSPLDLSMNELIAKVSRKSSRSKGRSRSQQSDIPNREEKLSRGHSDTTILQTTGKADCTTSFDQRQASIEGKDEPIKVPEKDEGQGDMESPSVPVKVTGKRKGIEDTESPVVPAKLTKEDLGH